MAMEKLQVGFLETSDCTEPLYCLTLRSASPCPSDWIYSLLRNTAADSDMGRQEYLTRGGLAQGKGTVFEVGCVWLLIPRPFLE